MTTMATEESVDQVESDLDRNSTELNGKSENHQPDDDEEKLENSKDANETGVCAAVIESGEQSTDIVVVSNRNEKLSTGEEVANGRASPTAAQDENGTDTMISAQPASDTVSSLGSQETDSPCVDSFGNEKASADDSELNGDPNPAPEHQENGFDADLASASLVEDDPSALRRRKDSLQQLCDVLMEERDRATSALKDKDGEVLRLRKRILEHEQEKGSLKSELAKALGRTDLTEKEMVNAKEENAKLGAEIVRLTKRIDELEAENFDLKCQLDKVRGQQHAEENGTPANSENVTSSGVEELQEKPDSVDVFASDVGGDEYQHQDGPKRTEATSVVDTKESEAGDSEEVKRKKEKAAQRSTPNYYRHSFAGSLPRPFHSFELPRQSSREGFKERSGSFHSDASGESADSESGSVPSFMRRAEKPTFLKSGFSPVQFNYQPLPESISAHRRESWDAVRHASMMRARGGSLNMTHSVPSDGQMSEGDSAARNHEPLEGLSHEQQANELNSAQDDLDGGYGKRESETEKYGEVLQLSSEPSPDTAEHSENSKNSEDSNSDPTASNANVPQQKNGLVESKDDRSQVNAEEEGKRETVSNLVNAWNNRTAEVFDV